MSAAVLRIQDALSEVAPDWQWSFSPLTHRGENKFKVVAKQRHTGIERTVYVLERHLFDLPSKAIVRDIIRFLPSDKNGLPMSKDQSINVEQQYTDLRHDYRKELDKLRRITPTIPPGL